MAFNKGILMLAIIALTGIFEVTCLPSEWKNKVLSLGFIHKCRKNLFEREFNALLSSLIKNFEECETAAVFSQLSQRGENAKAPIFSVPSDFPLACNASSQYITCAENFFDSVLFCERQPTRDRRNLITGAIRSYVGYLCSEDAKRLAALVEERDCIKKSYDGAKCIDELLPKRGYEFLHMMELYNRTFVPKVEKCVLNIFDQCPSTDPLFSPSSSAQKFMTDFKKLAGSIFNLAQSTKTFDGNLDIFFLEYAY